MKKNLKKEFVSQTYQKAFGHHLRSTDAKNITQLANTLFDEFISFMNDKTKDINTIYANEEDKEQTPVTLIDVNSIKPHQRFSDMDPVFSDTRGWCWSCWKSKRVNDLENELKSLKETQT